MIKKTAYRQTKPKLVPLGIPLAVSAVGTVLSLAGGKTAHKVFGTAWLALSLWHCWQHRRKLKQDAQNCFFGKI